MEPGVTILVPVLKRPHRVRPLCGSICSGTPRPRKILFIAEQGDVEAINAVEAAMEAYRPGLVDLYREPDGSNYARKINDGARLAGTEWLFLGADDLHFRRGWLAACLRVHEATGARVIGTNDLCNPRVMAGLHSTHFFVHHSYLEEGTIDQPASRKLLFEGYPHEYVDDEFIKTARLRREYAHAGDAIVEHLHPMVGKAPMDELYEGMPARMKKGKKIYDERKALWGERPERDTTGRFS